MSNITDALNIRNRMLRNFEIAVTASTQEECSSRLNVVIVGAGASGVEIAGALAEMRRYVMPRDYPQLDTSLMNIYLIEEQNRVLGSMSEKTSDEALKTLSDKGIRVILGHKIVDYENFCAVFDDGARIPTYNLIWTCGIKSAAFPGITPAWIGAGWTDEGRRIQPDYRMRRSLRHRRHRLDAGRSKLSTGASTTGPSRHFARATARP